MDELKNNLSSISRILQENSNSPEKITLVAVTKSQPVEKIEHAIALGVKNLGINYLQEAEALRKSFSHQTRWHYIGQIQSRKVRQIVHYDYVQSLGRLSVAEQLNRFASENQIELKVLLQINIGEEETKSGLSANHLPEFLKSMTNFQALRPEGLMCLPPPLFPIEKRRPYFKKMKTLYENHAKKFGFTTLSMGTSDDYAVALQEGANMIRLGTCLFGARK